MSLKYKALIIFVFLSICVKLLCAQDSRDTLRYIDSVTVKKSVHKINGVNVLTLSREQIEASPKMLGIADPLKAIQFLPGFGNGGDANSGLIYRGLSSGNNGYFYNGVQVHNPAHFFGLFPLFNTNVIKEVNIYNGVVPGRFFGRLSGYIDIESDWGIGDTTLFRGELSLFHGGAGVRLERDSSKLLEVFWRSTFMNKTLWPLVGTVMEDQKGLNYDLSDLNVNVAHVYGKNKFKAFLYTGKDKARFDLFEGNVNNGMHWGNTVLGLTHELDLREGLLVESSFGYSRYHADVALDFLGDDFTLANRQRALSLNTTLSYRINQSRVETGFVYATDILESVLRMTQEEYESGGNRYNDRQGLLKYFFSVNNPLSERISVNLSTALSYIGGDLDKFHFNPAFALTYHLNTYSSWFGGASIAQQATHHLPITSISIPVDYVIHSGKDNSSSSMRELSTGYRYAKGAVEFSVDGYYRWLSGAKEFDGHIIDLNDRKDINGGIVDGRGVTYGIDFFTKVLFLRNYLSVNYSFSRSFRQFDALNNGSWFRYTFDRPHNLSIVNAYKLSPRLSLSASYALSSGSNYTPVLGMYYFNETLIGEYGTKNNARMDTYHRLDLGLEYGLKQTAKSKQTLGFSVINVYNRSNPIFKHFSYERGYLENDGAFKMSQKDGASIPILPAVTYTLDFL